VVEVVVVVDDDSVDGAVVVVVTLEYRADDHRHCPQL